MKRSAAIATVGSLVLLLGTAPVFGQSQTAPTDPHHPPASAPAPTPGAMGEPREAGMMPVMDMCRQMMAGSMMGMSADPKMDPGMMAHMLEMRGEMMKAMGEVMLKHGRMMRGGATK